MHVPSLRSTRSFYAQRTNLCCPRRKELQPCCSQVEHKPCLAGCSLRRANAPLKIHRSSRLSTSWQQDKARIDEWKSKAAESFPGRDASFDDKLKWYHSFNDSAWDDFMAGAPEPPEFLPKVLLDACDDSVELQLIMKRSHAKKLNEIDNESKVKFMASAERARGEPLRQRVLNKARSTEKGLAAYVEWLEDGENGAPGCEMRPKRPEACAAAPPDVGRDALRRSGRRVDDARQRRLRGECHWRLIRDTGLYGTVSAPRITSDWSIFVHNIGRRARTKSASTCST